MPTMPNYFISLNGEVSGPYPVEYLKALQSQGTIDNQTPICPEGAPASGRSSASTVSEKKEC